jgi:FdhD protein
MKPTHTLIQYQQHGPAHWEMIETNVIVEAPVSLTVNGRPWQTFRCTPHDLEALAIGFLFTEGLIESMADIAVVQVCSQGKSVDVWLHQAVSIPEHRARPSDCTEELTADFDHTHLSIGDGVKLAPEAIQRLTRQLFESQPMYPEAVWIHVSALSDGQRICVSAEDIGRHNTLDKVAGQCLLDRLVMSESVLLTTGRISSDILRKAARMGTAIIISHTSPTSLSITLAEQWGITLIGHARRDRFNVYTHPWRILPSRSEFENWQEPALMATV